MDWIRDRALTLDVPRVLSVGMTEYLTTGHPWEALFENLEREFLQMAAFVVLTAILVQKGSPESCRPGVKELVDADPRDFAAEPDAPTTRPDAGVVTVSSARHSDGGYD